MTPTDELAAIFEQERPRLRAIASRILGSPTEAEDAVQEAWFRLDRANHAEIETLGAWLTVVVSRISLDQLRSRASRREESIDSASPLAVQSSGSVESDVLFEESVYEALAHALDQLSPLESIAFILHDLFQLPFEEVAVIVDRTPVATRKLASRARMKVAAPEAMPAAPIRANRAIIEAFLHAARSGDLEGLIGMLAPDAVLRADQATIQMGVAPELIGPAEVAGRFAGGAQTARLVWLDGLPAAAWVHQGEARVVFDFTISNGVIQQIWLRSDPAFMSATEIELDLPQKQRSAGG